MIVFFLNESMISYDSAIQGLWGRATMLGESTFTRGAWLVGQISYHFGLFRQSDLPSQQARTGQQTQVERYMVDRVVVLGPDTLFSVLVDLNSVLCCNTCYLLVE